MSKTATSQRLLQLLVRVINQSIQSYYYFPEVIICGQHRLEKDEFELLLSEGCIESYYSDSFGKLYRTSAKAEQLLHHNLCKRRHKIAPQSGRAVQALLPFC
jgi:hypothetical protein